MLPLLRPGDEVWIRSLPPESLRPGDIVAFLRWRGGVPEAFAHRVIRRAEPGRLLTRGDACGDFDSPVEARDCLGKVFALRRGQALLSMDAPGGRLWDLFAFRYARWVLSWWRTPAWMRRLCLVPADICFRLLAK